jgi:uncharacterized protein YbjT (DUF2867 family)
VPQLKILVTGVTGYIGDRLVPRLVEDGHDVRGFARNASKVRCGIPTTEGDAVTGAGLDEALDGVDVAYFLIHSMEGGGGFDETERKTAETFVTEARRAGVRRIVFLGGLVPAEDAGGGSKHLESRHAVEGILLEGAPESVALRASMVIGAGSRSFDFLASVVERLPVLALPAWRTNRTRPIDERDVVEYLALAGTSLALEGPRTFDVGGATELSYGDMVLRIAELAGTPRPSFGVPVSITPVASRVGAAIAGEDPALIAPLMDSLEYTLLPDDAPAREAFGLELRTFDESVRWALDRRAAAA